MPATMQSFFPLPSWCSEQISSPKMGDKGMGSIFSPILKRRRTGSEDRVAPPKKARPGNEAQTSTPALVVNTVKEATTRVAEAPPANLAAQGDDRQDVAKRHIASDSSALTPLQQVIEHEFNMQILMKHNELRLIEQELAKCQIGLEQLRRCEIKPYAGAERPSEAVSNGVGPAFEPRSGQLKPTYAAPEGVTNGPYTRHYRHWLLQDPQFEPMRVEDSFYSDAFSAAGRPMRHAHTSRKSTSRSVVVPTRDVGLPNYPTVPPKDKNQPQFLRRSTDGQLVKLVCNNCHRWNFSSIQGFLNHCRIAHKVDYKSHDAAAIDCGQTLDEQELANVPQESQTPAVSKPTPVRQPSTLPMPVGLATTSVHPLNTGSAVLNERSTNASTTTRQGAAPAASKPVRTVSTTMPRTAETPLRQSSQVPRLSALFAKNGFGGDLDLATTSAKEKIDIGDEDLDSPQDSALSSPAAPAAASGARTLMGHNRMDLDGNIDRPSSRKGFRQPVASQRHRPTPLAPTTLQIKQDTSEIPESPQDSALHLSPHTADSAPGLVSDNDDDNGSASEDEAPHSAAAAPMAHQLGVSPRDCSANVQLDIAMDDDLDGHAVVVGQHDILVDGGIVAATGNSSSRRVGKASGR